MNDTELAIRLHNLRWKVTTMHNIQVSLHMTTDNGVHMELKSVVQGGYMRSYKILVKLQNFSSL